MTLIELSCGDRQPTGSLRPFEKFPKSWPSWPIDGNALATITSVVALAPNSSETSPWDVLDTFPKLHSRAGEAIFLQLTLLMLRASVMTVASPHLGLTSAGRFPIATQFSAGMHGMQRNSVVRLAIRVAVTAKGGA